MKNIIVSIFGNKSQAEQARLQLLEKDRDNALGVEDAVTMEKTQKGSVRFHHLTNFSLGGALGGAFLGALAVTVALTPIFVLAGFVIGFVIGLVYGLTTVGIDPSDVESKADIVDPGQAALFVQPGENPAKVAEEIQKSAGDLRTDICTLDEGQMQCETFGNENRRDHDSGLRTH